MRKLIAILSLLAAGITPAAAQTDIDALRFGITSVQGTARNMGVANTMGTIGADVSALSTNPAGIGKISSSEFSLSPVISIQRSESDFFGNRLEDGKTKFQLSNLGAVFTSRYANSSNKKWNGIKFGISINRLANYNESYSFSGYNEKNSILNNYWEKLSDRDFIQSESDAANNYPFDASIAFQLNLLTVDTLTGDFYTATNNGNMQQDVTIRRNGGMDELTLGIASTYNDKIMVGASLGIPFLSYTERYKIEETDTRDSAFDLNSFFVETYQRTKGIGFNLKAGIIGMPIPNLRLSLAVQTPGIIYMNDAYMTYMEVDYASESVLLTGESPEGASKYKFVQPWKLTAGAGYIHKYGFISTEYELSDAGYSKFRFRDDNTNVRAYESYVNNVIRGKYGLLHTIKTGIEFRYKSFRVRGGVQYQSTPFSKESAPTQIKTHQLTYSGGLGYRGEHFFADITYIQTSFKQLSVPYTVNVDAWQPSPMAVLHTKRPAILFTLGYKL